MRLLFIGNSFTARNDLPGLLARMAASRGRELRHDLVSAGGASLRAHWNKGAALDAMQRHRYDWVILQEQSTLPVKNARRMHENVRLFTDAIAASGAKAALYLTWARRNAPASQQLITDAYTEISRETGALLIPVGVAWQALLRSHDAPMLHDRDGSHPSIAGTYLAACVFFASLFGESPVGIEVMVEGMSGETAALLQETAWRTVGQP